jgi:hypothetical protein
MEGKNDRDEMSAVYNQTPGSPWQKSVRRREQVTCHK